MSWTVPTLRARRRYQVPTHAGVVVPVRTPVQPASGWSVVVPDSLIFKRRRSLLEFTSRLDPPAVVAVVKPPSGWSVIHPNFRASRRFQVPVNTVTVVSAAPAVVQPPSGWSVVHPNFRASRRRLVPVNIIIGVSAAPAVVQPPSGWSMILPHPTTVRRRPALSESTSRIDRPTVSTAVKPPSGWSISLSNHRAFRCRQVPIHAGVVKGPVSAPPSVTQPPSGWSIVHASVRAACRGLVGGLIGCSEFAAGASPPPVNLGWLMHPLSLHSVRRSHTPYHVGVSRPG